MKISDQLKSSLVQCVPEQNQSLYDILSSQQGVDQFQYLVKGFQEKSSEDYMKTVPTPINRQVRSSQSKSQFQQFPIQKSIFEDPGLVQLSYFQFANVMDEFFLEINETQIIEWFQLLQINEKVQIRDFYIIVLMFLSRDSKQQFDYLYQYGEYLFECLKQTNNKILGLTLKIFVKLCGMQARQSQKLFAELKMKQNEEYTFEDFEVFCFAFMNPESLQGQGCQQKFIKQTHQNKQDFNLQQIIKPKIDKK
ncbi:unnamed protein product [Paramecium primaurelia]|uniref:Uncharacterized protein n=2 Tax=Paramecium TaxID=5884 RepID=A0A8S1XH55_9CILI|nr:unnamed protein product [Paramecium primaurelia]CAD8200680.1 unnamed protein product [Paramecium pentaurelia]